MAVSLVSTGVQFPDSTIQTTAAGASGLTLLSTVTASSSSTVDIETGIGSSYDFYLITVTNVTCGGTGNGIFYSRMKLGGSYRSDGYYAMSNGGYAGGSGNLAANQNSQDAFQVSLSNISTNANSTLSGEYWFSNPTSTSVLKVANWVFGGYNYGGGYHTMQGTGANGNYTGSSGVLTGIRFFFSSSTDIATGTFRLYGFAK